ncbi:exonuclease 3'-5' domain-containing protein 2 [Vanessa tameamea]|uniref:Exonuclease 3'-5' domain-containing protein 2 n=1 Tax=Vanessa tameamea TaxID=334116 RepID=A0A8B8HI29_VANTA
MNTPSKLQVGLTSAVALGFAGITYFVLKQTLKLKNTSDIIDYLVIKIITSEESCEEMVQELRRRCTQHHAVGFDCEWVTEQGKRHPVALLQLSTYDGCCVLFRLSHMKSFPKSLKDLLEDESIYKVGVAPGDDAKYLAKDYSVHLKSTLDIRHIVELCKYDTGGLASLAKMFLGVVLDKSWRVRCSNWGADELTERQIQYAALDAHVAIKIFVKVVNDYHRSPLLLLWRRNNNEHWNKIHQMCSKYLDICFKTKQKVKKKTTEYKDKDRKGAKEIFSKKYPHSTRSKPLYHNCFLQAPDGELLCTCDNKKAIWYVEKELADIVNKDPLTVRLRFEPAGRSVGDVGRYYQLTKENKCVVCGAKDSYIRKNVVPREYRKYFPEIMKDHSSHDVVLLCVECHQTSNMRDQPVREALARRCRAPLAAHDAGKLLEDKDCKKIRSAARALLYQSKKHVLPEARRKELESIILQHYLQHDVITQELLQQAAEIQVVYENADYESHGYKVVEYYLEYEGLLRLEEEWREHFLSSMCPKYMPELWSVKHNEERLRVRMNEGRLSEQDLKLIAL